MNANIITAASITDITAIILAELPDATVTFEDVSDHVHYANGWTSTQTVPHVRIVDAGFAGGFLLVPVADAFDLF